MIKTIQELENAIREAKAKYLANESLYEDIDEAQDLLLQLERNFRIAELQKWNGVLVQLALIGHAVNDFKKITPNIPPRNIKVAIFLARAFPNDIDAIWYLQDVAPETIFQANKVKLTLLADRLNSEASKRPLEEPELPEAKRHEDESVLSESTDSFEEWLNGTREWLEGMM